ncbi:MAG: DUF4954 family protein [Bacteroidales bacterium]|nr:DUF4954 family protein [Bacteroidales bacterium]
MDNVKILPAGYTESAPFMAPEFIVEGHDEFYFRNMQSQAPASGWRQLRAEEVERLVKNNNTSDNWDDIWVTDCFEPRQIKNNHFFGMVRIGDVRKATLKHHDLCLAVGITNSIIISCDIGNDVAIHNVHYLSHYIIGDRCILFNIDEMCTTDHAKFGNGIVKDGEPESVRVWMELMNETGCRQVMPFDGMITADAYLWAKYRDDEELQRRLEQITQHTVDNRRGYYGTVGMQTVIKNSLIIKDVKIGSHCYIKGASKLKNLTVNSSEDEPSQIGEGVILVNGIVGYGCHIFYSCTAVRFILGNNSNLKYGARLIHSFLGDNSTISCCEVLNNLIFPAHEQHHNNSFLVAAVLMGQSNMAAGATLGSNHNSRTNDNEIQAGRGFWPGLCSSVKHSCKFASYTLLSKADYPAEMNIPLPFALVNNNVSENCLEVMPAFWWMYNMYALKRNAWKYGHRDKRIRKVQHIEFDTLAPDTVEEILSARQLLAEEAAKALLRTQDNGETLPAAGALRAMGRDVLENSPERLDGCEILGENMEKGHRRVRILKAAKAYAAYGDMVLYYAATNLMKYMEEHPRASFADMAAELRGKRQSEWVNLGGQLVNRIDLDRLRRDIRSGILDTWADIHRRYDRLWKRYPADKQKHAFAAWCALTGNMSPTEADWKALLEKGAALQEYIYDAVYSSRRKDYDNIYRKATFRNPEEMKACIGVIGDNTFIVQVAEETKVFLDRVKKLLKR